MTSILQDLWELPAVKNLRLMLNWAVVIVLIVFGWMVRETLPTPGIIFIVAGFLISPFFQEWLWLRLKINLSIDFKVIIILASLLSVIFWIQFYESKERVSLLHYLLANALVNAGDERGMERFQNYLSREELKARRAQFLAQQEELTARLKFLSSHEQYQSVIREGKPYAQFDVEIEKLVREAELASEQQQLQNALIQVPQLMKEKKYWEVYQMAAHLKDEPALEKPMATAKKQVDNKFNSLQKNYTNGHYEKVVKQGEPYSKLDCRVEQLIGQANRALARKEERKFINQAIKKIKNHVKNRQFQIAYDYALEHKKYPELFKWAKQVKYLEKKDEEKKILAKLRNIPAEEVQYNIREYSNLLKLFPDNEYYQEKLAHYKQELAALRKQPPLPITEQQYGDKWPFTVSQGTLECIPPGIITFHVNKKTYAVNGLASSRGYTEIDKIWRDDPNKKISPDQPSSLMTKVDLGPLIERGLELCKAPK